MLYYSFQFLTSCSYLRLLFSGLQHHNSTEIPLVMAPNASWLPNLVACDFFFMACDTLWTLNPISLALAIPLVLWNYTFQVFLVSPWPFLLFDRLLFLYPLLINFPGAVLSSLILALNTLSVASATTCTLMIFPSLYLQPWPPSRALDYLYTCQLDSPT